MLYVEAKLLAENSCGFWLREFKLHVGQCTKKHDGEMREARKNRRSIKIKCVKSRKWAYGERFEEQSDCVLARWVSRDVGMDVSTVLWPCLYSACLVLIWLRGRLLALLLITVSASRWRSMLLASSLSYSDEHYLSIESHEVVLFPKRPRPQNRPPLSLLKLSRVVGVIVVG